MENTYYIALRLLNGSMLKTCEIGLISGFGQLWDPSQLSRLEDGVQNVTTGRIQALLEQHWAASAAGNVVAEHDIYDENVLCEYPQSGERIRGRQNLQALRGHHPGKPGGFDVRRIVGAGELWVTEYAINYEGKLFQTLSIMEFRNEKVIHGTQYFAEPFAAPAWLVPWVEHAA